MAPRPACPGHLRQRLPAASQPAPISRGTAFLPGLPCFARSKAVNTITSTVAPRPTKVGFAIAAPMLPFLPGLLCFQRGGFSALLPVPPGALALVQVLVPGSVLPSLPGLHPPQSAAFKLRFHWQPAIAVFVLPVDDRYGVNCAPSVSTLTFTAQSRVYQGCPPRGLPRFRNRFSSRPPRTYILPQGFPAAPPLFSAAGPAPTTPPVFPLGFP